MKGKGKKNKKKQQKQDTLSKKQIIRKVQQTQNIQEVLQYTHDKDDDIRLEAVKQLCPCKVLIDIQDFWNRVFQMVDDSDSRIRQRILHIICDGSPDRVQQKMVDALQHFNRDPDPTIRRQAHKVIGHYNNTGKWNIM